MASLPTNVIANSSSVFIFIFIFIFIRIQIIHLLCSLRVKSGSNGHEIILTLVGILLQKCTLVNRICFKKYISHEWKSIQSVVVCCIAIRLVEKCANLKLLCNEMWWDFVDLLASEQASSLIALVNSIWLQQNHWQAPFSRYAMQHDNQHQQHLIQLRQQQQDEWNKQHATTTTTTHWLRFAMQISTCNSSYQSVVIHGFCIHHVSFTRHFFVSNLNFMGQPLN